MSVLQIVELTVGAGLLGVAIGAIGLHVAIIVALSRAETR